MQHLRRCPALPSAAGGRLPERRRRLLSASTARAISARPPHCRTSATAASIAPHTSCTQPTPTATHRQARRGLHQGAGRRTCRVPGHAGCTGPAGTLTTGTLTAACTAQTMLNPENLFQHTYRNAHSSAEHQCHVTECHVPHNTHARMRTCKHNRPATTQTNSGAWASRHTRKDVGHSTLKGQTIHRHKQNPRSQCRR